jgi:hypothetical protein
MNNHLNLFSWRMDEYEIASSFTRNDLITTHRTVMHHAKWLQNDYYMICLLLSKWLNVCREQSTYN